MSKTSTNTTGQHSSIRNHTCLNIRLIRHLMFD